jgi:hypothetical protein
MAAIIQSFFHLFLKLAALEISLNFARLPAIHRRPDKPVILCQSLAFSDRFFYHLPRSCWQWSHPTPVEVPQAFVYVATV